MALEGEDQKSDSSTSHGKEHSNISMDASSVYYLHPSDSNSQLQVGDLLTPTNYGEWVVDVTDALIVKNKIGFVDGTIPKPAADSEQRAWTRCDAHVKGWLRMSMSKEVRSSVRYAKSAREIWVDLKERFGQGSLTRGYELRRMISALWQEKLSVSAFYTQLRALWEEAQSLSPTELCTCGSCTCGLERRIQDKEETARLYDFLMGLDESFGTVRSQVLSMKPTPKLAEAFNLVLNDEQQRLLTQKRRPNSEAAAFASQSEGTDRGGPRNSEGKPICTHCGKIGHFRATCYDLVGWPNRGESNSGDKPPAGKGNSEKKRRPPPGKGQPKAAQAEAESSSVAGFTVQQLEQLRQFFNQPKAVDDPIAHMAGLTLQERDWEGDSS
ncbi:unnamed protein product [Linum trigynum]|uniref:CCHC-type domain-containing protein n=1 Tax=Linum trigynum TaxID=586398 RepID=A0AAV2DVL6_9ROSI